MTQQTKKHSLPLWHRTGAKNRQPLFSLPRYWLTAALAFMPVYASADMIVLRDGMVARGALRVVTADQVTLRTANTNTVVTIPADSVAYIQIHGMDYSYNAAEKQWDPAPQAGKEPGAPMRFVMLYEDIGLASGMVKDTGPLSWTDSIYRHNFFTLCFKGKNVELAGEEYAAYARMDKTGAHSIRRLTKNPYSSGNGYIISGVVLYGVSLFHFGVGALIAAAKEENSGSKLQPFIPGFTFTAIASCLIPIGVSEKKRHLSWKRRYR